MRAVPVRITARSERLRYGIAVYNGSGMVTRRFDLAGPLMFQAATELLNALAPGGRVSRYRPLRGGVSATVYLVHVEASDGTRRAVVERCYAAPWHRADPEACTREFKVLDELNRVSFPVPRPLVLDQQGGLFGAPTLVTTRLPGKPVLLTENIDDYVRQIANTLVQLHNLPIDRLHFLPDQTVLLSDALSKRTLADDPLEPGLREAVLTDWPQVSASPSRRALVHGDYWPGNLLWQRGRLVGVVDWEDARLLGSADVHPRPTGGRALAARVAGPWTIRSHRRDRARAFSRPGARGDNAGPDFTPDPSSRTDRLARRHACAYRRARPTTPSVAARYGRLAGSPAPFTAQRRCRAREVAASISGSPGVDGFPCAAAAADPSRVEPHSSRRRDLGNGVVRAGPAVALGPQGANRISRGVTGSVPPSFIGDLSAQPATRCLTDGGLPPEVRKGDI